MTSGVERSTYTYESLKVTGAEHSARVGNSAGYFRMFASSSDRVRKKLYLFPFHPFSRQIPGWV